MTKIIALCGGPGAGKSTLASGLFYQMKQAKFKCELVTEVAKEITWEKSSLISNQLHIFAEQYRRQYRLLDQVDYVITDSPLFLSCTYYRSHVEQGASKFKDAQYHYDSVEYYLKTFNQFDNAVYFVERTKEYLAYGRSQTREQAIDIDQGVLNFMNQHKIPYEKVTSDDDGIFYIMHKVRNKLL